MKYVAVILTLQIRKLRPSEISPRLQRNAESGLELRLSGSRSHVLLSTAFLVELGDITS